MNDRFILIVDNTKNLKKAFMTPKLIKCLEDKNVKYKILSERMDLYNILCNDLTNIFGIILSGGPLCLSEALTIDSINKNIALLTQLHNIPILGICFGFQVMAASYGGKIISMKREDTGKVVIYTKTKSRLFKELGKEFIAYQSHKDKLREVPPKFKIIAKSSNGIIQGIENKELKRYGCQFHPEGLLRTNVIIFNFIDICLDDK
jgi:GMP synthase (glutamine-hydrolysing)